MQRIKQIALPRPVRPDNDLKRSKFDFEVLERFEAIYLDLRNHDECLLPPFFTLWCQCKYIITGLESRFCRVYGTPFLPSLSPIHPTCGTIAWTLQIIPGREVDESNEHVGTAGFTGGLE